VAWRMYCTSCAPTHVSADGGLCPSPPGIQHASLHTLRRLLQRTQTSLVAFEEVSQPLSYLLADIPSLLRGESLSDGDGRIRRHVLCCVCLCCVCLCCVSVLCVSVLPCVPSAFVARCSPECRLYLSSHPIVAAIVAAVATREAAKPPLLAPFVMDDQTVPMLDISAYFLGHRFMPDAGREDGSHADAAADAECAAHARRALLALLRSRGMPVGAAQVRLCLAVA
jgi:hypothetical protein